MKKRILSLVLAAVLVFGLLSGCRTPDLLRSGETYEIRSAADLLEIAKDPTANYILKADIDMQGIDWTPVNGFSGLFDGNEKTISNLTIETVAPESGNMGLFGDLTETGKVKDLHLENVIVHAGKTDAINIGTVTGVVAGKLEDVTATGAIYDTRTDRELAVGCLAGKAVGKADIEGGESLTVTDDAGIYTTENISADVELVVADSEMVRRGLVGVAEESTYVTGLWRDSYYSSKRQSQTIRDRQQKVVDYMYKMGTIAWTVPKTVTHYGTTEKEQKNSHIHTQVFKPGETYYGIPYDHTSGSYERFMYCLDENGQMLDWVAAMGDSTWGEDLAFTKYMGNDCSAAVAWAWMQVSPNVVSSDVDGNLQNGAYVFLTTQMVPNFNYRDLYGIYPVGSWNGEKFSDKNAVYGVMSLEETPEIFDANGMERMMEAYAHTRKADALLFGNPGGHVRLVAEDPVVIRNGDGSIDTKRSYFLCHEQGDGLYNNRYEDTHSSWRINYRYTFEVMANGSRKMGQGKYLEGGSGDSYIPITIHALRKEEISAPYAKTASEITEPTSGQIYSNYRIQSTTVTVKDSNGKVIYDRQVFVAVNKEYPQFRDPLTSVDLRDDHSHAMNGAAAGTYTFTVKVLLANGEIHTIVDNKSFTKA